VWCLVKHNTSSGRGALLSTGTNLPLPLPLPMKLRGMEKLWSILLLHDQGKERGKRETKIKNEI